MASARAFPGAPDLVIDAPDRPSARVSLINEEYRLGRSDANDLAFPKDHRLSREHFVIERAGMDWCIRDLDSRNGTKINGQRLSSVTRICHGDLIQAGHLVIRFDTRHEYETAGSKGVTFVDDALVSSAPSISVDLQSALAPDIDLAVTPTVESTHLEAVLHAGRELAGQGNPEELCSIILSLALRAVKASRGVVMTGHDANSLIVRSIRGEEPFSISTVVRDAVLRDGKSVLVRDTRLDEELGTRQSVVAQDIRSILAVPLQTDERVIGLLYLDSPCVIREFSVQDLNLVTVMANIAAIRIEHVRLLEEENANRLINAELERAAEIQRGLLPAASPAIATLELSGHNVPCRTVGGDYFDFLPYSDGRVGIFLGDVSGKGLAAALLMSSLRACVHVLFEDPDSFAENVNRLNRSIAATCPTHCFITLFMAVFNPSTGQLLYANAGHNAPLLIQDADNCQALEATGVPLGMLKHAAYEIKGTTLEFGDLLVIFSDGITEACPLGSDEDFGERRLSSLARRFRNQSAPEILHGIEDAVEKYITGTAPFDDMTLVVAKRIDAGS